MKAGSGRWFTTIDSSNYKGILGLLIVFLFIFRWLYISYGPLDLAPDEAHYWEWSRRLDMSYYSKGPMIAYIIALFTGIGGNSELGVRIGAVLISLILTLVLFHFSTDILKDYKEGFFSAFIPHLTPLFAAGSILMTIDSPFILFWGLSIYSIYRGIFYKERQSWLWAGLFTGLGLLSKYTMALLYPCILLYLIFSKEDRFWLKRFEPYTAVILSSLFFLPVLIWNYQHDWIGFRHVIGQTHIEDGLRFSIKDFLEFIGSQIGILTPFLFLGLIYGMYKGGIAGFRGERERLFLFMTSAPILIFFLSKSLQGKVEANWAGPAYITGIPLMVDVIGRRYYTVKTGFKRWLKCGILVSLIIGLIITASVHYPDILRYAGINLLPKNNPATRLMGWEELGKKVSEVYRGMEGKVFILSDRYQIASELAFYVPGNPRVYNINIGRRMNQYDIWGGLDRLKGWDAVYVKWDRGISLEGDVFSSCEELPPLQIMRDGLKLREFYIYRCYGFKEMPLVKETMF